MCGEIWWWVSQRDFARLVGFRRIAPENFGPFTLFLVKSRRVAPGNFGGICPASVKFSHLGCDRLRDEVARRSALLTKASCAPGYDAFSWPPLASTSTWSCNQAGSGLAWPAASSLLSASLPRLRRMASVSSAERRFSASGIGFWPRASESASALGCLTVRKSVSKPTWHA